MKNKFIKISKLLKEIQLMHITDYSEYKPIKFTLLRTKITNLLKIKKYKSDFLIKYKIKITPFRLFKYDNTTFKVLFLYREIEEYNIKDIWDDFDERLIGYYNALFYKLIKK